MSKRKSATKKASDVAVPSGSGKKAGYKGDYTGYFYRNGYLVHRMYVDELAEFFVVNKGLEEVQ
ncbi:MAG: hypothetical protein DRN81_06175 [Thermoproteota archaeon]|nr:MAG: hypothetical protein DRN81_06175 [Candidatus Korarchaeota archaeon]